MPGVLNYEIHIIVAHATNNLRECPEFLISTGYILTRELYSLNISAFFAHKKYSAAQWQGISTKISASEINCKFYRKSFDRGFNLRRHKNE